jgi:NAD(P)-dependent dehydrogenase (short-subunit alcohol dehydrogenase family)
MTVSDLFRLDGKTAIVTGGGRGIGRTMAEALAEAGARVVICSRDLAVCQDAAADIEARGGRALATRCDVTQDEEVEEMVKAATSAFDGVHILVNNSGVTWGEQPERMPVERFQWVLNVNVTGAFRVAGTVARSMIERGTGGTIVNIASTAALMGLLHPPLGLSGYAASKGAVISMTRELAVSWAKHGITVNALAPGWFPSDMSNYVLEHFQEDLLADIPLHRFGSASDLAGALLFLASPAAAYMTGQVLVVDGGLAAH